LLEPAAEAPQVVGWMVVRPRCLGQASLPPQMISKDKKELLRKLLSSAAEQGNW
jgi:hypothetical protein